MKMRASTAPYRLLIRISEHTQELKRLRDCGDDDRLDRAFNAVCKTVWGYTLDDFDDESLTDKDHVWLDRLTWKRACAFAAEAGYDLIDHTTGDIVTDWWGFVWMILAEKRGLLTPEGRAAAWQRYEAKLRAGDKVVGVIRGQG
jgi:hypothetical protein